MLQPGGSLQEWGCGGAEEQRAVRGVQETDRGAGQGLRRPGGQEEGLGASDTGEEAQARVDYLNLILDGRVTPY